MKILCIGDIVGAPGRRIFKTVVTKLRQSGAVSAVIANAENAAGGKGITAQIADELFAAGADVLTLGDHVWDQKDTPALLEQERRIVRPANLPTGCPGRGWTTVSTEMGEITVMSLIGRTFMNPADCPFAKAEKSVGGFSRFL